MWKVYEILPPEQLRALVKLRDRLANTSLKKRLAADARDREARRQSA